MVLLNMTTPRLISTVSTGIILQVVNALLSIFKIPVIIKSLGVSGYIHVALLLSFWTLLSIQAEAQRKNARNIYALQGKRIGIPRPVLTIFCSIFVLIILSAKSNSEIKFQENSLYLFLLTLAALGNFYTSTIVGEVEARGKIDLVNTILILNQILTFPFLILAASTGNKLAIFLSILASYTGGNFLVFLYAVCKIELTSNEKSSEVSNAWPEIVIWELLPGSLTPYIASIICSETDISTYFIYLKFSILFAILPVALGPLNSLLIIKNDLKSMGSNLLKLNIFYVFVVGTGLLILHKTIIGYVGNGQVEADIKILFAVLFSGSVGVLVSSKVNSSTTGRAFTRRLVALRISIPLLILANIILMNAFGIISTFYISAFQSLFVYLFVNRERIQI